MIFTNELAQFIGLKLLQKIGIDGVLEDEENNDIFISKFLIVFF